VKPEIGGDRGNSRQSMETGAGVSLALALGVFRATVLSTVLTMAIGPDASMLCSIWCQSRAATTAACQHQDAAASPRMTGEDSCRSIPAVATSFVRDESNQRAAPDAHHATVSPAFLTAPQPAHTSWAYNMSTPPARGDPPLLIALRI
jgi:hypothetical protein